PPRAPSARGMPARSRALPVRRNPSACSAFHQRPHLDSAAHACRRHERGELDRGVDVVGLCQVVAGEHLLPLPDRPLPRAPPSVHRPVVAVSTGWRRGPPRIPGRLLIAMYSFVIAWRSSAGTESQSTDPFV